MRDSISKKQVCNLVPNQRVVGKWHRNTYLIVRKLGNGATGTVYLAQSKVGLVALKVASDSMSITSEVNVLRQFTKVQGPCLGPSFYDADDYVSPEGVFPFYTMEYISGEPFLPFIRKRGMEWVGILLIQLLGDLHRLHEEGWVFGDLKPENLLVSGKSNQVRWLDPGGMTRHGRSIKEYTEFFDRGYWGLGDRKAEPSYDLFSASMLIINRGYPARFEKSEEIGQKRLITKLRQREKLLPYELVFRKGIEGKYQDALEMREDIIKVIQNNTFSNDPIKKQQTSQTRKKQRVRKKSVHRSPSRWTGIAETMMVASFLLILYILYLFGQTM